MSGRLAHAGSGQSLRSEFTSLLLMSFSRARADQRTRPQPAMKRPERAGASLGRARLQRGQLCRECGLLSRAKRACFSPNGPAVQNRVRRTPAACGEFPVRILFVCPGHTAAQASIGRRLAKPILYRPRAPPLSARRQAAGERVRVGPGACSPLGLRRRWGIRRRRGARPVSRCSSCRTAPP
jgi:hypothetical protein